MKVSSEKPEAALIAQAVHILKKGGIVAYPTETFYGLGVDGHNEHAIEKVFRIKGRNFKNPIPIIIGNTKDLVTLVVDIQEYSQTLLQRFWPGPLTMVFMASLNVSSLLTASTGKIGIRISRNPIATALATSLTHPITATSANPSGQTECTTASEVIQCIGHDIDMVIDGGPTPGVMGSTILDVTAFPPVILREGVIPASRIFSSIRDSHKNRG